MLGGRLSLALCLVAAACAAPPELSETGQPIIGGSYNTGKDPAVGVLLSRTPGFISICSASMITPRVVITAAHCIDHPATTREIWFADSYDISNGELAGLLDGEKRLTVKEWVHPRWDEAALGSGNDLGLLLLDKPIPASITPLAWNRTRIPQERLGDELRMVGFGHRIYASEDPLFLKLTAKNNLTIINKLLQVDGRTRITCQGDSGGPSFLQVNGKEVIAGVTSYGDQGCSMYAAFTRVDVYHEEISAFITANDPPPSSACGSDGTCGVGCQTVDPDCPCADDGQCTTACADIDSDHDCPENCGQDGKCVRSGCPVPDPDCGDLAVGELCSDSNDCVSGLCAAYEDGKICSQMCGAGASAACPASTTCSNSLCLPESGGCSCAAGGPERGGALGGLLVLSVILGLAARGRRRAG
jgi:V8-like Glu-specific endopeptidase